MNFFFFFFIQTKIIINKKKDTEIGGTSGLTQLQYKEIHRERTNQINPTQINPTNLDTQHRRNPANPRTGAKPSYKKRWRVTIWQKPKRIKTWRMNPPPTRNRTHVPTTPEQSNSRHKKPFRANDVLTLRSWDECNKLDNQTLAG
jgi:hypothetical protein